MLDLPGLKVELFMILFYLSNYIIYYNSEELSVYINGLIHYVEKDAKIQSSKIFTNLFMIFLYHLQIMQSNYDPCYHQTSKFMIYLWFINLLDENQVLNELNLNSKLK